MPLITVQKQLKLSHSVLMQLPPSVQSMLEQEPLGLSPTMTVLSSSAMLATLVMITMTSCFCSVSQPIHYIMFFSLCECQGILTPSHPTNTPSNIIETISIYSTIYQRTYHRHRFLSCFCFYFKHFSTLDNNCIVDFVSLPS